MLCAKTYKRLLTPGALPRRIEFTSRSVPWYDVVIDVDVPIGIGNRMPNSREQFAPMLQPEPDGVFGIVGELGCTLKDGIRYGWVSRVVNTERFPVPAAIWSSTEHSTTSESTAERSAGVSGTLRVAV